MQKVNDSNVNTPEYWDKVYRDERGSGKKRIDNERLDVLVGLLRERQQQVSNETSPQLLDVGCGNAELLTLIHAYLPQWRKSGIDITPETIAFAQTNNPAFELRQGTIYDLPYSEGTFDVVFCGETLEHLEHPAAAIAELFRVTKPNGYVAISTPNEHANYSHEHLNEFTVGECIGLTSQYGQVDYEKIRVVCNGISIIWTTRKKEN